VLISVIGCATGRPFPRHHPSSAQFREGTGMPEPPKASAEAISASRSGLVSAVGTRLDLNHRGSALLQLKHRPQALRKGKQLIHFQTLLVGQAFDRCFAFRPADFVRDLFQVEETHPGLP
jgi:hypothetical protein